MNTRENWVYLKFKVLLSESMRCIRCNSINVLRFIDGFGNRRVFCRNCGRSFLENIIHNDQRRLIEFGVKPYYNPEALRVRW